MAPRQTSTTTKKKPSASAATAAAKKPVAKKAVVKKPVVKKAVVKKPVAKKPAAKKPDAKKAVAKKAAANKPVAKKTLPKAVANKTVGNKGVTKRASEAEPAGVVSRTREHTTTTLPERVPILEQASAFPTRSEPEDIRQPAHFLPYPASDDLQAAAVSHASESEPRRGEQSGKYVYCVIQTEQEGLSFGAIGIGADPSDVHTVRYKDIAAVVSDAPIEVYDPTRENVLAHERVNDTVMRRHTVIPMSFGTVFNTREDIIELLRSAYDAFRDVLTKMQNKFEFGLKVLWDPDQIIRALEADDESLRRLKEEISNQRGSTYFARMQYGRLVDQLLQERSESFVSHIFGALRDVSVASRANKPIGDRMILNAAFLVSRDQEAAFDEAVKRVGAQLENLTFRYTGPWPPYNFVNIRLKLERAKETE